MIVSDWLGLTIALALPLAFALWVGRAAFTLGWRRALPSGREPVEQCQQAIAAALVIVGLGPIACGLLLAAVFGGAAVKGLSAMDIVINAALLGLAGALLLLGWVAPGVMAGAAARWLAEALGFGRRRAVARASGRPHELGPVIAASVALGVVACVWGLLR